METQEGACGRHRRGSSASAQVKSVLSFCDRQFSVQLHTLREGGRPLCRRRRSVRAPEVAIQLRHAVVTDGGRNLFHAERGMRDQTSSGGDAPRMKVLNEAAAGRLLDDAAQVIHRRVRQSREMRETESGIAVPAVDGRQHEIDLLLRHVAQDPSPCLSLGTQGASALTMNSS